MCRYGLILVQVLVLCVQINSAFALLMQYYPPAPHTPVQNPRYFAAGQRRPELGSFRRQAGVLEHAPGEVPLLHATEGYGVAVNCAFQVGMDPGQHTED